MGWILPNDDFRSDRFWRKAVINVVGANSLAPITGVSAMARKLSHHRLWHSRYSDVGIIESVLWGLRQTADTIH
jgi:hypothetical protein